MRCDATRQTKTVSCNLKPAAEQTAKQRNRADAGICRSERIREEYVTTWITLLVILASQHQVLDAQSIDTGEAREMVGVVLVCSETEDDAAGGSK